ncbi:MAG: TonB-dependent receptor [Solirubrobacterales bacterium]
MFATFLALSVASGARADEPKDKKPSPDPNDPAARYSDTVDVEAELPAIPPSSASVTRTPVPVQELPVSASVVPRSLLDAQDAFVLNDALKNVSGVSVGTGFGVFDYFTIRGFDSLSSGLVLTDNAAEPESMFYPMYNVRQVEVVKGPAAFLYGGNALAGAVQLVRKQPVNKRFANLSLTYGRYGTFEGAADANLANSDGSLSFRLNGAYQGTDSYRDVGDGSIRAINPALTWQPGKDTRVTANLEYVRSEWPPDSGLPYVGDALTDVDRKTSYQSPFDQSTQDAYRLRLDAEHRVSKRFLLRNKLYYTDLKWVSDGTLLTGAFPLPFPGAPVYAFRTLASLNDRQKILGDQIEGVLSFDTGKVAHELLAGFELSKYTDDFTQDVGLLPPIAVVDPVETAQLPIVTLPQFGQAGDSKTVICAPYVVDRLTFSPKVQAFVGGRFDIMNYDDAVTATSRDANKLSPLGGITFMPVKSLSLYVSAGQAFAPPSTQVVGPRDPEESWQIETGVKKTFLGGKGFTAVSFYQLQRDNIAIPDSSGLTRQAGDQRSRGIELELSAEARKGWVTYASYAYTDAELTRFAEIVQTGETSFAVLDRSGNRPPFAPRHLFNLWTSKQFENGLGLAAGARFVGKQFISEDNRYSVDDYVLLDAAVSYRTGRLRASVNLKNIADQEYETRGFGAASAIPGRPFEVLGRVEVLLGAR